MKPWAVWILLILCVILVGVSLAGGRQTSAERALSSLQEFGRYVVELLRETYPDRSFVLTEAGTEVEAGEHKLGLVNLYRDLRSSEAQGKEIDSRILKFYESSLARHSKIPDQSMPWSEARKIVRPQLVPAGFISKGELQGAYRELLADLEVAYVLDAEDHYVYVGRKALETWGIDTRKLDEAAMANLAAASRDLEIEVKRPKNPEASGKYLSIAGGDGYAATRILLPDVRRRLASLLGKRFFVGIPSRDFLMAWSLDLTNHDGFIEIAREAYEEESHPISSAIYMCSAEEIRQATQAELERRF